MHLNNIHFILLQMKVCRICFPVMSNQPGVISLTILVQCLAQNYICLNSALVTYLEDYEYTCIEKKIKCNMKGMPIPPKWNKMIMRTYQTNPKYVKPHIFHIHMYHKVFHKE